MGYATKPAPHMLAFGMSGIGDVCDRFVQNDATYEGWTELMELGGLPVVKGHKLNDDDKLRRLAILNIMCNLELPWKLTEAAYGAPAERAAGRQPEGPAAADRGRSGRPRTTTACASPRRAVTSCATWR